jgi:hypothetical protein
MASRIFHALTYETQRRRDSLARIYVRVHGVPQRKRIEPARWPVTVCVTACSTFCETSLLFPFCPLRLLAKTWLHLWYRLYDIVSSRTYHQHILISDVVANAFVSIFAPVYLSTMIHPSICTYMYNLYILSRTKNAIFISAAAWDDLIICRMLIQSSSNAQFRLERITRKSGKF